MVKLNRDIRRQNRIRKDLKAKAEDKCRLTVFRSSKHIYAQIIDDARHNNAPGRQMQQSKCFFWLSWYRCSSNMGSWVQLERAKLPIPRSEKIVTSDRPQNVSAFCFEPQEGPNSIDLENLETFKHQNWVPVGLLQRFCLRLSERLRRMQASELCVFFFRFWFSWYQRYFLTICTLRFSFFAFVEWVSISIIFFRRG